MNMTDHCNAIREKANQMSNALWSLVFAAIAAYLVWTFAGDAPWWVYALFFIRPVLGFARALGDEPAMQKAPDDHFGELPIAVGENPGNVYLLNPNTKTRDLLHAGCVIGTIEFTPPEHREAVVTSVSGFQDSAHCQV